MMSKRPYLPLILLLCLLLLSCRSDGNGPTTAGEPATLTLAVPDGAIERYRALTADFMEEYEGITVQVESMSRLSETIRIRPEPWPRQPTSFPPAFRVPGNRSH